MSQWKDGEDTLETTEPATRIWKPRSAEQRSFLELPDSIFEAFFGGCVGVGKSEILVILPILKGLYKLPRFKGLIMRRTHPELESEILVRAHDYYPKTGGIWNYKINGYEWKEYNSRIRFGHAQHEKDIRNYDTDEYQYFAPDELTSFTQFMYLYIAASRCRSTITGLAPIVRTGGTPGNVGHGWVRKRFVEPCKSGGKIVIDKDENKRIFVKGIPNEALYKDSDPNYFRRLKLLPEAEYLAKMGDWWTFSGQVFDDWRIEPFKDEPINACHVVKPFEIPNWWPRIFAMDVGYKTYQLWGAISPDERLYVYREKLFEKAEVFEYGTFAREASLLDGKIIDCVLDHTAYDATHGETTATLFKKYSKMNPRPADKGAGSRVAGKSLLQDMMRWRTQNEDESIPPKLQIFESCEYLINTIPLCVYDKKDGVEQDDIAEFVGDEPIDTIRYLARSYVNFSKNAQRQFDEFQKTAHIIRKLETTGDMTSYYRQMEKLEGDAGSKSVRRKSWRRSWRRAS